MVIAIIAILAAILF
ncbi:MAG: hypothetical protein ACUVRR_04460, partial [Candidatus Fervidibacter sp.]